jgi:predicted neutral ceramidase superfamily lipid hydrolase
VSKPCCPACALFFKIWKDDLGMISLFQDVKGIEEKVISLVFMFKGEGLLKSFCMVKWIHVGILGHLYHNFSKVIEDKINRNIKSNAT